MVGKVIIFCYTLIRRGREVFFMKKWMLAYLVLSIVLNLCGCGQPDERKAEYDRAQALFQAGDYTQAEVAFTELGNYLDSKYMLSEIKMALTYEDAVSLIEIGDYPNAYTALCGLGDYRDALELLERFRMVELTRDNWDTYFEITQSLNLDEAYSTSVGTYYNVKMQYSLGLKEEYHVKLYEVDRSELVVEFIIDGSLRSVDGNFETGEYILGQLEYTNPESKTVTAKLEDVSQPRSFLRENIAAQCELDGTVEFYFCTHWDKFTAQSVEGHLYLYEE